MALELDNLVASAFLDDLDRYAKAEESIAKVRLWFDGDSPAGFLDLTPAEYAALSDAERTVIITTGSAARFIDTTGTSNA